MAGGPDPPLALVKFRAHDDDALVERAHLGLETTKRLNVRVETPFGVDDRLAQLGAAFLGPADFALASGQTAVEVATGFLETRNVVGERRCAFHERRFASPALGHESETRFRLFPSALQPREHRVEAGLRCLVLRAVDGGGGRGLLAAAPA